MKKAILPLLLLALAVPAVADDRHQSYVTYSEEGTVLLQDDGREIDAHVNVPLFPGDELRTARRGRAELRLSDGNIVALDRSTAIRFHSILDSYEGDASQTVGELLFGEVIVHRRGRESQAMRLDTEAASYVSPKYAIYAVDSDGRGNDIVKVFEGTIEVRTPSGTARVREGEEVRLDARGIYDSRSLASSGRSDFESWYLRRAERYGSGSGRYLSGELAYAERDLDAHGSWVYAGDYGSWVWRPYVSVGWRPYYHGRWSHSRWGSLVWVSDEPWGWVPYHYGRWAFSPRYGWVWLPGASYSHAWVYWLYGPSYVGWVPAGWYDCYRPYYSWLYRPYGRSIDFGIGFHGRIRLSNVDLRGWTFVSPNTLVSTRTDRAALTTDAIRNRLQRDGDSAVFTSTAARFDRNDIKDPSAAVQRIARRGIGSGTGKEGSGSAADMTPFFRRDPELSSSVRERIVARSGRTDATPSATAPSAGDRTREAISRTPRGEDATPAVTGRTGIDRSGADRSGNVDRERITRRPSGENRTPSTIDRSSPERAAPTAEPGGTSAVPERWRGRVVGSERGTDSRAPEATEPETRPSRERPGEWRRRTAGGSDDSRGSATREAPVPRGEAAPSERFRTRPSSRSENSDSFRESRREAEGQNDARSRSTARDGAAVPRRVIDGIGGITIRPSSGASDGEARQPRSGAATRERGATVAPRSKPSRPPSSTSSDSGSSSSSSSSSGSSTRSSRSRGSESSSSSSSRSSGRVKRGGN